MNWLTWSLLSAGFAAATAILAKIGIAGIDSNLATAIRTTVILLFTWGIAWATGALGGIGQIPGRGWLFLVLSGIATGFSWLCYFRELSIGNASSVAPVDKLSVVFVIVFAGVFLGEKITWIKAVGGLLIAAGAVVLALA
jgi:transporter family protein